MPRKRFVMIEGSLHEIGGDNAVIIDGKKWFNFSGRWEPADAPGNRSAFVLPDIAPYQSMVDGTMITSRSHHREHLRQHNCIEVGNERLPEPKREFTAARGLREELIARING